MGRKRKGKKKSVYARPPAQAGQQAPAATAASSPAPRSARSDSATSGNAQPRQSQAQKRARHALASIKALVNGDYGNYVSYVNALPARIIMNGLGQALAMEKASAGKDKGHEHLFNHMQGWLLSGWEHSPYAGNDLFAAITGGSEQDYIRAQAEAMAYLEWLKKFAAAFLKTPETAENDG